MDAVLTVDQEGYNRFKIPGKVIFFSGIMEVWITCQDRI
jgi:hypothetical protein